MSLERVDFFVSHAGSDREWAEWVTQQLRQAGYTVELDTLHWQVGRNFVMAMSDALDHCDRVVALLSAAYFERNRYTMDEWTTALLHDLDAGESRLVPVRVEPVSPADMPALLRTRVFCDLFGLDTAQARRVLLAAVGGPRPGAGPVLLGEVPRASGPRPGPSRAPHSSRPPRVWNIPTRNPGFTGRDELLTTVRNRLIAGDRAAVQVLQGMGGVGKTQLAAEYAQRFAGSYDVAWWIDSEQAGLIGDQFAALGSALGGVQTGADTEAVRAVVLAKLRERDGWLLVFDNAEDPADIVKWLPGGNGHVLITSRERDWTEIAVKVEVDVLTRSESMAILRDRIEGLSEADADRLAAQLGDLPLAIAQATGFMTETGMPSAQYLELLKTRASQILDRGAPRFYPRSLVAATQLVADRLTNIDPAAAQLASLCAFLAAEPIPEELFTNAPGELPGELASQAADPLAWHQILAHLSRQSLARIDRRGIQMHQLTQAILRDRLSAQQAVRIRACAEALLVASDPGAPGNPVTWPTWTWLMPHVLSVNLGAANPELRRLADHACAYLLARGDVQAGHLLASELQREWHERLGRDHRDTLLMASHVARSLRALGRARAAEQLDRDTLTRRERILGRDHRETLVSASNLAADLSALGDREAARELDQNTLARRRAALGEDDPDTLVSASNLAADLSELGETQAARIIGEDTLIRRRRILGEDHPSTLITASNLANTLSEIGEKQAARTLDEGTLAHRRHVLGEDHPSTLITAINLAKTLSELGETQAARELAEDTLTRQRRVLGAEHPSTRAAVSLLAEYLGEPGGE